MNKYFDLLEKTLDECNLRDKPGQIFNIDESGFALSSKSPKYVFEVGKRQQQQFLLEARHRLLC